MHRMMSTTTTCLFFASTDADVLIVQGHLGAGLPWNQDCEQLNGYLFARYTKPESIISEAHKLKRSFLFSVWDMESSRQEFSIQANQDTVWCCQFIDQNTIATGGSDIKVSSWSLA